MMNNRTYVTVILPLKLAWEPWYYALDSLEIGQRVRVRLAGKEYVSVVSSVGNTPDIPLDRIQPIVAVESSLESVTVKEIELWRFMAEYYLCTVGEVYKVAYPAGKQNVEARKPRKKASVDASAHSNAVCAQIDFNDRKPVLLVGASRTATYDAMIERTLREGKDVLMLSPKADNPSYVQLREISKQVRRLDSVPQLICGRRSMLFLPYAKLGLVIVDEEQDSAYKQESPSPRYNGRDTAVMLAHLHGASVVLGTACPSLESLMNADTGKYILVDLHDASQSMVEIIDVSAERRKRGMVDEEHSIKLMEAERQVEAKGGKVLEIQSWELSKALRQKIERYSLVAVMHAEFLLSKNDYKADEKALQQLLALRERCHGLLIVQTHNSSHPVFEALLSKSVTDACRQLLRERKEFMMPPYSRQVNVNVNDNNEARLAKMKSELVREIGDLHVFFPKNANLAASKKALLHKVEAFETSRKYTGHIHLDVDPV